MSSGLPINISGTITAYKGNGRKLGYPTANISTQTDLADGVYFGFANLMNYRRQPTLIFIGTPTTVGDTERRIEAHLFDIPDHDYYDQNLELSINHFYRDNQHFDSVEELLKVMHHDEHVARQWFREQT